MPRLLGAILWGFVYIGCCLLDFLDREHRVRVSAAASHFCCDPDRFHNLLRRRAMSQSGFGVAADAVGALGDMGHGDGDQLFHLCPQSAVGEYLLAESLKGFVNFRG